MDSIDPPVMRSMELPSGLVVSLVRCPTGCGAWVRVLDGRLMLGGRCAPCVREGRPCLPERLAG